MNSTPKYMDVYNRLKGDILEGRYPLGSLLPTENELVEMYGVSKVTVRHAIQMLKDEEIIRVQQGRGAEVILPREGVEYSVRRYRNATSLNVRYHADETGDFTTSAPYIDTVSANMDVAKGLDIPAGTPVYRVQRTHAVGNTVVGYITHYVRTDIAPDLPSKGAFKERSLYDYLKAKYNITFVEGSESIGITVCGLAEAHVLNVAAGTPLFLLKRRAYCEAGILEYCEALFNPNNFGIDVFMKGSE